MTVSEAKTFGFLVALIALLTKAHDLLKAAGLDVDKMIAVLQKLQADAGHIVGEAHGDWANREWCEHKT